MIHPARCLLLIVIFLTSQIGSTFAAEVQSDPRGSAERQPLLDALRSSKLMRQLAAEWKSPLVFHHVFIRRVKDWAYVAADPHTTDGRNRGESSPCVMQKIRGRWQIVDWLPDDIVSADDSKAAFRQWQRPFLRAHPGCPPEIFPADF